jgi:hypothetical protein
MRYFTSKKDDKKGSVLTFFALLLPVFFLMTSFVVDLGKAFVLKSELNKACLIAAEEAAKCIDLSKAQDMGINTLDSGYVTVLGEFFYNNVRQRSGMSIISLSYYVIDSTSDPRYIEVRSQAISECHFLRIFGIGHITVNAKGIGRLKKIK